MSHMDDGPVMSKMQMHMNASYAVGTVLFNGAKVKTGGEFFLLIFLILLASMITGVLLHVKEKMKRDLKKS